MRLFTCTVLGCDNVMQRSYISGCLHEDVNKNKCTECIPAEFVIKNSRELQKEMSLDFAIIYLASGVSVHFCRLRFADRLLFFFSKRPQICCFCLEFLKTNARFPDSLLLYGLLHVRSHLAF